MNACARLALALSGSLSLSLALSLCGLSACDTTAQVGSDCEHESCEATAGSAAEGPRLPDGRTTVGEITRVDLLLVIDDSASMVEEQLVFSNELQRFLDWLVRGELDGGGMPEFYPAQDMHVGVVSSDLGVMGGDGVEQCNGIGDDGALLTGTCGQDFARYSVQSAEHNGGLAMEILCRTALGTAGCGFEHLLEAPVRALSAAPEGHGTDLNEGFLRDDSLLVIVVISDEDDCSLPDDYELLISSGPSDDPTMPEALSSGCLLQGDTLPPTSRYTDALRALRPSALDRVMFFAITGVPPGLASSAVLDATSLEDQSQRDAFYDAILAAPEMQPTVDAKGTADTADDVPLPVCNSGLGPAYPGRRLVEAARSFGVNGLVQSICDSNLSPAFDNILRSVARRLGPGGI